MRAARRTRMKKPHRSGAKVSIEGACRLRQRQTHRHHTTVGCTARGAEKAPPGSGAKLILRSSCFLGLAVSPGGRNVQQAHFDNARPQRWLHSTGRRSHEKAPPKRGRVPKRGCGLRRMQGKQPTPKHYHRNGCTVSSMQTWTNSCRDGPPLLAGNFEHST